MIIGAYRNHQRHLLGLCCLVMLMAFGSGCGFLNKFRKSKSTIHNSEKNKDPAEDDGNDKDPNSGGGGSEKERLSLDIFVEPTHGVVDTPIFRWVEVQVIGEDGERDEDFEGSITVEVPDNAGAFIGTTTETVVDGVATFDDLTFVTTGDFYFRFSSSMDSVESNVFTIYDHRDGGDGLGSATAYLISNVYQLQALSTHLTDYNATYVKLSADIDASETSTWFGGAGFKPIGTNATPAAFYFSGDSKLISDLYINRPTETDVGFFGGIAAGATVKKLTLEGVDITGGDYVGALFSRSSANIVENISVFGEVSGSNYVGGVGGCMEGAGTMAGIYADTEVSGASQVGGLLGCANTTGYAKFMISDSNVTASADYVGGAIGFLDTSTTTDRVHHVMAHGRVKGRSYVGGLAGQASNGTIKHCAATGSVTSTVASGTTAYVGGLVGLANEITFEHSYATAGVHASSNTAGGLIGYAYANPNVTYVSASFANGPVRGSNEVGGLIGSGNRATIDGAFAGGKVDATGAGGQKRGIVASEATTFVYRSFAYATGPNSGVACKTSAADSLNCAGIGIMEHGFMDTIAYSRRARHALKVGYSDQSTFYLDGECDISAHSTPISLTFVQGGTNTNVSTTCLAGKWEAEDIDLSVFSDGAITVTTTMNAQNVFLTLTKDTDLCASAGARSSTFASGSGTTGDPYIVCTRAQYLNFVSQKAAGLSYAFKLGDNIELGAVSVNGDYGGASCATLYCNVLDGDGFKLSKPLMIHSFDTQLTTVAGGVSVFGKFGFDGATNAEVKNLVIEKARIIGGARTSIVASELIASGRLDNVVAEGTILMAEAEGGGLAAFMNDGMIDGSTAIVDVLGNQDVGGAIGYLLGDSFANNISETVAYGAITGTNATGGFVGLENSSTANVQEAAAHVQVLGGTQSGGFGGYLLKGTYINTYASGNVATTGFYAGGYAGQLHDAVVAGGPIMDKAYASGSVSAARYGGGFCGRLRSGAGVYSSFSAGDFVVDSFSNEAGFISIGDAAATLSAVRYSTAGYVTAACLDSGTTDTTTCLSEAASSFIGGTIGGATIPIDVWGGSDWSTVLSAVSVLPYFTWE